MSEFVAIKAFPHICVGDGCGVCHWIRRREAQGIFSCEPEIAIESVIGDGKMEEVGTDGASTPAAPDPSDSR